MATATAVTTFKTGTTVTTETTATTVTTVTAETIVTTGEHSDKVQQLKKDNSRRES